MDKQAWTNDVIITEVDICITYDYAATVDMGLITIKTFTVNKYEKIHFFGGSIRYSIHPVAKNVKYEIKTQNIPVQSSVCTFPSSKHSKS